CWPAYAGVLSSLGVGFVGTTAYLLPLTATFLAIAVGALTFGARRHGRHGPLALGLVGSAIVLLGKFVLDATAATLGGVGMAVAAKAKTYGIRSVPAVVIDGKLADCCAGRGPEEAALRAAGLGRPLP